MNLYDKYVGMDYVPIPFDQMAAAGQMQQKQYDMSREDLNRQEDVLADMKVRPVDVEYKNKLMDELHRTTTDLLAKNKYYSPDMFQEVRSTVRKFARDPKVSMLGSAYENYAREREIEERLRTQGKDYFYNHKHNLETPLYNQDGLLNFDPTTAGLGIEEGLNYAGAAMNFTNRLTPYKSKGKGLSGTMTITRSDGSTIEVPTYRQESISELSSKDPRVQKDVRDMVLGFSGTPEGRQYIKRYATNPDGTINEDKVFNYMLSTVAEKRESDWAETPMPGFASLNKAGGNGNQPISNPSDAFAGLFPNDRSAQPSTQMALNYKLNISPEAYAKMSKQDRADLYKYARNFYDKEVSPIKSAARDVYGRNDVGSFDEWLKQQGSSPSNPYGNILNKFVESKHGKDAIGKYNADVYNIAANQASMEFLQNAGQAISPDNAMLINGDKSGDLLGNHLENVNFQNFERYPTGEVVKMKDPKNPKLFTTGSVYNIVVDEDTAKAAGINTSDNQSRDKRRTVNNSEGKAVAGYIIPVLVQHESFVTPEAMAQYDKSKDANWDEKYNTAGSYQNDFSMWRANSMVQRNFDYIKQKVQESGADIAIDNSGQIILNDPQRGQTIVDPITLLNAIQ